MTVLSGQLTVFRCAFCGEHMLQGRSDKKTCSAKCRNRLFRWRKRLDIHMKHIEYELGEIASYLAYPEARPKAAQLMVKIQDSISETFAKNNIKKVGAK